MKCLILQPYQREFDPAPRVAQCGVVEFEKLDPRNPAWFFGRDAEGIAGFFPVAWFEVTGSTATAKRDYDATELTVRAGDAVQVLERHGRWARVEREDGTSGWIPEESLP
jgi:hypothetical protein